MAFLTNPNLAYILVVAGFMLVFLAEINSKTTLLKIGIVFCLIAVVLGFLYLRMNPWAFFVVALSPLPFFSAVRQARVQNPLFFIAIAMLIIGSFFLFVDQDNLPIVSHRLASWVSIVSAIILWISAERLRNVEGVRLSDDPSSVVGLIGETKTDLETHSAGSVLVEGELWQARSKEPISAGSTVRVLRQDGLWLTVKKVENLTESEVTMSLEKHEEKEYSQDVQSVYAAALKAVETLDGKIATQLPENFQFEAKFPKTILKNTLGERTHLTCVVSQKDDASQAVVDAYPLDAVERKLTFGARKGVTQTVVTWFWAHLEHHLGKAE